MYVYWPDHFRTMISEVLLGSHQDFGPCFSASRPMAWACDVAKKPLRPVNLIASFADTDTADADPVAHFQFFFPPKNLEALPQW